MEIRQKIKDAGFPEQPLDVHTSQIYKKQFTFPQIAHNDFAVEQFDLLEGQQQNLMKDPENEKQKEEFVQAAEDVA